MNEKNILSLLVGPGLFSNKELKEVASRALNTKFLQEFDELNIKIPDAKENEPMADDGDASPISIDDEEERRMQEENERMSKKVTGLFSKPNTTKNLFQKSQYESTDYENFEDDEEQANSTEQTSGQIPFMIPKAKELKPNPYEKMNVGQILTVIGSEKSGEIYRLSDLYLPTTKEHRGNVFKYLYKNMMRNPKDALRMSKNRHEGIKIFEKQILTMFGRLYEHKFMTKQEVPVAKAPEANVFLQKDTSSNPTSYSSNPIFSPLNSAEWFESLERDLMKGIKPQNKMEVEKEAHEVHEELDAHKGNGEIEASHFRPQNGPIVNAFGNENKLIPMEPSSRRVAHGTPSGHTAAGIKEKERTDKYNFQKVLSSLFESTPTRDNDNQEPSMRSEEDQSVANPFGGDSPGNDNESTGFHKVYNRSVNQNMREYLNDHYERDRKALFSFYTGLKGHDKEETALWGEVSKEGDAGGYDGMNGKSGGAPQEKINYNYVVLPFQNEKERSIFKYETDIQDASEMEMSLLQKKRKLDKNSEIRLKVGVSIESMYYNKNVLEASWNDFFFKAKINIRKEREYGQIVIDLNDKSVFYDKIHPIVFGVQKATRKAVMALEEVPDQAGVFNEQFDDRDVPRIDTSDLQPGNLPLRPSVSKDYLGVGGTQHVPSESGSMSIGNRKNNITKQQKLKLKAMRVEAVKSGLNLEHLTKEDARNLLLGRTGKPESKLDNVALPNILRVINDLKKKISTQSIIQHSKVAEEFQFNEFHIKKEEFEHFHRPDMRRLMNDQAYQPWRIEIVKQEEEKKDQSFVPEDPFGVNELVHSFEHFKNHRRLSLKEGKFALFEYIEENPLILSNVGMASRINRYVYSQRAYAKVQAQQTAKGTTQPTENEELVEFVKMIKETLGPNGSISFLDETKNIPLIGQLTKENFVGITVLDNNLFYAPIFIHKAPETDFVMVRYTSSDGTQKCYLRKIEYIYTVGQIEPKVEVFNPSCRGLTSFIRKSTKHIIKKKFKDKETVFLEEMKQLFPTVNDHNMKKAIQRYGGDPDPDDNKRFFYNKDLDNELNDEDADRSEGNITPEEVCQYERMHASNVRLKNVGLEDLRSCDKINTVRKRYMTRNNLKIWNEFTQPPDKRNYAKMNIVANYVSEELQLTAWNLSQSFLSSKQKQGRLCLTGFGDPTSGHGGYSYVKLPLKTSRYEKEDKKSNASKLNQVTGTEADLRKLPIKLVDKMILTYGNYKEDHISKLTRWDKIDLLRQIANEHPDEKELKKYTRQFRLTTKMQKEKYQKDINALFMKLVDNLSRPGRDDIPSDNEGDFDCGIEQLVDKELEDTLKKAPKDLKQAEAQAMNDDDDEKGDDGDDDDGDGGDDASDIFQD